MAFTVFQLSLGVIAFTLTIATIPTCADQISSNAVTTSGFGKEKLVIKNTATASPHHEAQKPTYTRYEVGVRDRPAIMRPYHEMEMVKLESTSTAADCNFKETADMDLATLLVAGDGAMVTLVAGKTRLTAHRAVLTARSPVFATMLCNGMQDASSGHIAIPDVEGPVLRQVLAYLYTLKAPQLPSMAPQLLAAADKFGLSALKAACEEQVAAQLTVETAAATAELAIRHSSASLRQAVIAFIRAHLVQVISTKGWADAVRHHPEDVFEVYRLLNELPAETSTPAVADSQPITEAQIDSHSSHGRTSATATATPPRQTPTPDGDAVSRLRSLSADEKGQLLLQAATEGRVKELEALLSAGAELGARDREGKTALYWAAHRGHMEAVRRLLEAGQPDSTARCGILGLVRGGRCTSGGRG